MTTVGSNISFQNPDQCQINSVYNYSKLEFPQKGFKFKYASEKQLQKAIKRVRQERKKIYDEKQWIQFVEKKHKELISPVVNQTKNEFAQILHKEQTLISDTVHLNSNNAGHGESTLKCKTCGYMRNINAEQGEQHIGLLGQSVSNMVHSPQTHVLGTVLEENLENEHSSVYLFSSLDGHCGNGIQMHNYQPSLFFNSTIMQRLPHLSECIQKIEKSLMAVHDRLPISDESAERELIRNTEFAARFTRNYLYRIHRQEKELEKFFSDGISDFTLIEKKISSICQTVIQAVEVYHRHVLKCTSTSTFKHLEQIVRIIDSLLLYIEKLTGSSNFLYKTEIQYNCDCLLKELTKYNKLKSEHKPTNRNVHHVPIKTSKKCSNPLYMYEPKLKQTNWKKQSALLAKKKFGIPQVSKHKKVMPAVDIGSSITQGSLKKEGSSVKNCKTDNQPKSRCGNLDDREDYHIGGTTKAVSEDQIVTMVELIQHDEVCHNTQCL